MYTRLVFLLTICLTGELFGQSIDSEITTRSDQIQAERLKKDAQSAHNKPATTESWIKDMADVIRPLPIRFLAGGLGPGYGFAIGSVLEWKNSKDSALSRLWGQGALHGFYSTGAGMEIKDRARDLTFALDGSYADAPQLRYYGPGPDSSIHNQTDFRQETTLFNFRVDLPPQRRLAEACRLGELLFNVGPGTNHSLPSTESVFGPAEAPGINVQSNYLVGGCSAQLDLRDFPEDPHKGTYLAVSYDRYDAQKADVFSFNRISAVAEQYFPFLNQKRVIALRAKTDLSLHSEDQVVPFYLQPTLGSDTDLRGFRRYRFYDENSIVFNAEYRWEISTAFDTAVFADFGRVFHRPGEIHLLEMESSAGFGFRLKRRTNVLARLDTGFSREGVQVWFKFGKLY